MPDELQNGAPAGVDATPTDTTMPEATNTDIDFGMDFDSIFESLEGEDTATPDATAAAEGQGETPPPAAPGTEPPAQQQPIADPAQPAVAAPDPVAEMRTQLASLAAENQRLQGMVMATVQQRQQPEAQPSGPPAPQYNFAIPDQVMNMIRSENPQEAQQALSTVLTDMAHYIHKNVLEKTGQMMQHVVRNVIPAQQQAQQAQQEVFRDFYGTYPRLNHPAARPIVLQAAQELARSGKYTAWTREFKKAITEKAVGSLREIAGRPKNFTPVRGEQPRTVAGNGASRPAGGGSGPLDPNSPEAIREALFVQ